MPISPSISGHFLDRTKQGYFLLLEAKKRAFPYLSFIDKHRIKIILKIVFEYYKWITVKYNVIY